MAKTRNVERTRLGCGLLVLQLRKMVPKQVTGNTEWSSFPEDDDGMEECFILPGDIDNGGQCTEGNRYILEANFDHSDNMLGLVNI